MRDPATASLRGCAGGGGVSWHAPNPSSTVASRFVRTLKRTRQQRPGFAQGSDPAHIPWSFANVGVKLNGRGSLS